MAEKDDLAEAKDAFDDCYEAESDNRAAALDDLKFARLGEQWDEKMLERRRKELRPALTINKLPAFIRQVVNDARQNKPQIKVKPVDSHADPNVAEILNGLIRNIEYVSKADIAYDTAAEFAVTMGFGFIRVTVDYAYDDTFDMDLCIKRVANPFCVYSDPYSTAADSSDWNTAFVTELLTQDQFETRYPKADKVNWDSLDSLGEHWHEENCIRVAEWWKREETKRTILRLSSGEVMDAERFTTPDPGTGLSPKDVAEITGITVLGEREVPSYKVTQRHMNGAEVLSTKSWAGRYIPIIPVYGDEVNIEGKRHFRSLIRDAKDAQKMFNYWRTTTTELVALAPKAPFIGAKGSFDSDIARWETANADSHPFLEYDPVPGQSPPQRQPFAGIPAGALQEALNASDDMKAILGLYDASLGARSNETSGKAIVARQREGDISTFHFIDNLSRAIRHTGCVLLDLIPSVYNSQRIIRVLGREGEAQPIAIAPTQNGQPAAPPKGFERVYDLTVGKYDIAVDTGPSFTTRREEVAALLTEMMRAWPQAIPILGDLMVKYLDLPDAEEIRQRLQALQGGGVDPQEVNKLKEAFQKLQIEHETMKADRSIEAERLKVDSYKAESERMKVVGDITRPQPQPQVQ